MAPSAFLLALGLGLCVLFSTGADAKGKAGAAPEPLYTSLPPSLDFEALVEQGQRFEHGEGVDKDYNKAIRLYCIAAMLGDAKAAYNLGWMYLNGRGVERNDSIASGWLRRAVKRGDRFARRTLRRLSSVRPAADPTCPVEHTPSQVSKEQVYSWVRLLAPYYDLEPDLVLAVIDTESGFDARARSPKDARGLMQLIPATAKRFGVKDPWDPLDNLLGGMAYLRWLLVRFDGDVRLALAGYNAGEHAVDRHRGVPPYKETRNYVARITGNYTKEQHPIEAGSIAPVSYDGFGIDP